MFSVGQRVWHRDGQRSGTVVVSGGIARLRADRGIKENEGLPVIPASRNNNAQIVRDDRMIRSGFQRSAKRCLGEFETPCPMMLFRFYSEFVEHPVRLLRHFCPMGSTKP